MGSKKIVTILPKKNMIKEKRFINHLHNSTKRNYLKRVNLLKPKIMKRAKKYSFEYWDGTRNQGYGGYKYIPGRWKKTAKKLIKYYKLKPGSKILDVGCGKGFLLYELLLLEPKLKVFGTDISGYAIKHAKKEIKNKIIKHDISKKLPFKSKYFDLVLSINTIHNLEIFNLKNAIEEIQRVGKKKFMVVESFRNEMELFNLQCWALTCQSFFSKKEWIWLFNKHKYNGNYEFIYF